MKGVPLVSFLLYLLDNMPRGPYRNIALRVNPQTPMGLVETPTDNGGSKDSTPGPSQVEDVRQGTLGRELQGEGDSRQQAAVAPVSVEKSPVRDMEQRLESTMVLDSPGAGPSRDGKTSLDEGLYKAILEGLEQYERHVGGVRHELGALMKRVEELIEQSGEK